MSIFFKWVQDENSSGSKFDEDEAVSGEEVWRTHLDYYYAHTMSTCMHDLVHALLVTKHH